MATILSHIRVLPGAEARFEAIAAELHRATHDREAAVCRYEYWRGREPGTYYALLSFDDFRGFLAHQTSEHHERAGPLLREIIAENRLEWVDPIQGLAPLPPTNGQTLPDDASELEITYSDRYPPEIQDWWIPLR